MFDGHRPRTTFLSPVQKTASSIVTTFRVNQDDLVKLAATLPPIAGLGSHHLVARKLLLDYIDGKLVYLSKRARESSAR